MHTQIYATIGTLFTCRKHWHSHTISPTGGVRAYKISLTLPLFTICLYQVARKVSSHVFVCLWYLFFLCLYDFSINRFWNYSHSVVFFVFHFIIFDFDFWFSVFNATFDNISTISWRPVLVVEEARVPGENHRPWASNW